jgi:sn-glycerol 3-phosphate transport system permease protein
LALHERSVPLTGRGLTLMDRRTVFSGRLLPYLMLAPQLVLTVFFFYWPAGDAAWSSFTAEDAFGQGWVFVGFDNFKDLLTDPLYLDSALRTVFFCGAVSVIALSLALLLAVFADHAIAGRAVYRTLLIWPYAIAPAMSAVLFVFLLNPRVGLLGRWLNHHGIDWDYTLNGTQAMGVVIAASAWKQVSYNFIFFLAGLQSIPRSVIEAARMDGAKGWYRFRTMTLPLLAPTTFFLLVVNIVYAAFDTFGTIYALTQGGPGKDTETLVIKVFRDGYINHDIGGSSAQSVILMFAVIGVTAMQFRFMGRRTAA